MTKSRRRRRKIFLSTGLTNGVLLSFQLPEEDHTYLSVITLNHRFNRAWLPASCIMRRSALCSRDDSLVRQVFNAAFFSTCR